MGLHEQPLEREAPARGAAAAGGRENGGTDQDPGRDASIAAQHFERDDAAHRVANDGQGSFGRYHRLERGHVFVEVVPSRRFGRPSEAEKVRDDATQALKAVRHGQPTRVRATEPVQEEDGWTIAGPGYEERVCHMSIVAAEPARGKVRGLASAPGPCWVKMLW